MTTKVSSNGELIHWDIKIRNKGASPDTNVVVSGNIPNGLSFVSIVDPIGGTSSINGSLFKGEFANLEVGVTKIFKVITKVDDITQAPFNFVLTITGDNVDSNLGDNTKTLTVESTVCDPSAGATGLDTCNSCIDLSTNDTQCSQCETRWKLDLTSKDNVTVVSWDEEKGKGIITLDDYTKNGSIKYSIWCVNCKDGNDYEVSGPALITINKPFTNFPSDSLTYNDDGTYTHKSVNGTSVTFKAGWTKITKEANNSFTFTYPDGSTINYNFLNIENVTTLIDNSDGTHTYTSEDGTETIFNTRFKDINIQKFLNLTSANGDTIVSAIPIPPNEAYTHVFRNGLLQIKGVDYVVNGFNIIFNETFGGSGGSTPENIVVYIYQE